MGNNLDVAYDEARIRSQMRSIERACLTLVTVDHSVSGPGRFKVGSGFVVELLDNWLWITAAHCIDFLDEHVGKDVDVLLRPPLDDGPPLKIDNQVLAVSINRIREILDHSQSEWTPHKREMMRLLRAADVGFIVLPDAIRTELARRGLQPLARDQVRIRTAK
jgi:hypothetical protein